MDYTGVKFSGYRVTRRMKSPNHSARWELTCQKCDAKRSVPSSDIRREMTAGVKKRLAACKCVSLKGEISFRPQAIAEEYSLNIEEFRAVLAVMAHERAHGEAPTRIAVSEFTGGHPSATALVRKGWLKSEGLPMRLSSTPKAWRELGFTR